MISVVRYVTADAIRSQRWVSPLLLFAVAVLILNADVGPPLTTYAATAAGLLPIAIWLTVVILNAEDPVQTDVSSITVGSRTKFWLGKMLTAFLACAVLSAMAVIATVLAHGLTGATVADTTAGLIGHLLVALLGVAIGGLGARPVMLRSGWAFLLTSAATLADIIIRHAPPTRRLLELFNQDQPSGLTLSLVATGAETVVLAALAILLALGLARWRS